LKSPPSEPLPLPNGSPHLAHDSANGSAASRQLPSESRRRSLLPWVGLTGLLVLGGAGFAAYTLFHRHTGERADALLFKVVPTDLQITVTEKGTLESAENSDVVCKVRAGSKGYSSSINWVIDDGTLVKKGQLLMILDDSDFQDRFREQKIKVDQALAAKLQAEQQYHITLKQNEIDIAIADSKVLIEEINVDQYTGFKAEEARLPLASLVGTVGMIVETGVYKQKYDDLTGQLRLAESESEQNRERAAWAERMVKMKYMSSAQAQAERSRLESSIEKLRSIQTQRQILANFTRRSELTTFNSALENARKVLDQFYKKAEASEIQADVVRRSAASVYLQELDKLKEIEDQIRECKIHAPQDGMVVYYKSESSSRFSSSSTIGMIEQGAQVKEGQRLLRIPDLRKMQVNTKVHEAMVSRIRGDIRKSTGFYDSVRGGLILNPHPMSRLVSLQDDLLETLRSRFRQRESYIASPGQRASIRVDARADRTLTGHVRSVATIASQQDYFSSGVKLYSTLVLIDDDVEGLKPDMTAEVTIHVDAARQQVLAIPIQAVVGGTELGAMRKVFVRANGVYEDREVKLGLANERMVEVLEGLHEGDEVVLNPKILLTDKDKAKTHEVEESRPQKNAPDKGDATKTGKKKKAAAPKSDDAMP